MKTIETYNFKGKKKAIYCVNHKQEEMIDVCKSMPPKDFMELKPEEIAYPRSCNNLRNYSDTSSIYKKGTPMHVKGALVYNFILKKDKLTDKYPLIQEGDKIKFLHMKQPNIYTTTAFSFLTSMPRELNIMDKIDYDVQFTKSFVEPLKFITTKILWNIDDSYGQQGTLEDFFT